MVDRVHDFRLGVAVHTQLRRAHRLRADVFSFRAARKKYFQPIQHGFRHSESDAYSRHHSPSDEPRFFRRSPSPLTSIHPANCCDDRNRTCIPALAFDFAQADEAGSGRLLDSRHELVDDPKNLAGFVRP